MSPTFIFGRGKRLLKGLRWHREGAVIALRSTVDNTRGPFTVYTFVASLMRDGAAPAPLGTVVLDEHY